MQKLRKVVVQKVQYERGVGYVPLGDPYEASFHAWGVNYEDFDQGPGTYSVAIIELANGKVELVQPELITFQK